MVYRDRIRMLHVLKRKRNIALEILSALVILVISQACSKDDDLPLEMADGNRITLSNNEIVYYSNESDFYIPICQYSHVNIHLFLIIMDLICKMSHIL